MQVTFWGVRGSIATSGAAYQRYGGNTTCVEIEAAGERLIIDAGTGLRPLGQKMLAESAQNGRPMKATLLFTHLHWDHIQGFPFFTPAFVPSTQLDLHGPNEEGLTLERALVEQMRGPQFPVPLGAMRAHKRFHTMASGESFRVGDVVVTARALCHPQGSLGYRIEAEGKVFAFATDTEHLAEDSVDESLLALADGADLFVYDAQYTPDEYVGRSGPSKRGWGHSTYEAAALAARAAKVGRLGLFHHDPAHDDTFVDRLESAAKSLFSSTFATREGLCLAL